jgi:hypothetical protein
MPTGHAARAGQAIFMVQTAEDRRGGHPGLFRKAMPGGHRLINVRRRPPTCGLSTAEQCLLTGGARIATVTAVMADRSWRPYGSAGPPDELVQDPAQVLHRTVE